VRLSILWREPVGWARTAICPGVPPRTDLFVTRDSFFSSAYDLMTSDAAVRGAVGARSFTPAAGVHAGDSDDFFFS